jgi:hypothetical protein
MKTNLDLLKDAIYYLAELQDYVEDSSLDSLIEDIKEAIKQPCPKAPHV